MKNHYRFTELIIDPGLVEEVDGEYKLSQDKEDKEDIQIIFVKEEIKQPDNFGYNKACFGNFIRKVTYMSSARHIMTVKLKGWSIVSKDNDFGPFLVYKKNPSLKEKENEINWNLPQILVFIYGCLRGFSHLNSLNLYMGKINTEQILLEQSDKSADDENNDEKLYYPLINNFDYCENDEIQKTKLKDQLESFGKYLDSIIKDKSKFTDLIERLKGNGFVDFRMAALYFENLVFSDNSDEYNLALDKLQKYKEKIDEYEKKEFLNSRNQEDILSINQIPKEFNKYQLNRKLLKLANDGNGQAAFRIAMNFYNGEVLPEDLVSCIVVLQEAKERSQNLSCQAFLDSIVSISKNGDNAVSYYYKGALCEAKSRKYRRDGIKDNDGFVNSSDEVKNKWIECIKNAVNFYQSSLQIKPILPAISHLGAIFVKYFDDKTIIEKGLELLDISKNEKDAYGMVCLGLYNIKEKEYQKAEKIFTDLYGLNYIDALNNIKNLISI